MSPASGRSRSLDEPRGFPPHIAASVEAVGSTGGQVAPPVMGAAAFLMAEYLQGRIASVAIAAVIPAFLFYTALFIQVDLESAKLGIMGQPRESLPSLWRVLREGWHFPSLHRARDRIAVVGNLEAENAALWATATLIILVLVGPHKGRRMKVGQVALRRRGSGRRRSFDIIAITAISGNS